MDRTPTTSSLIKSIGYDAANRTLEVEFVKGGVYQYSDVPPAAYDELMAAQSIGKHYGENIRGVYASKKVEAQPKEGDK